VVPLKDLMKYDAVEEATEPDAKEQTGAGYRVDPPHWSTPASEFEAALTERIDELLEQGPRARRG
jgi:hypothetical protein